VLLGRSNAEDEVNSIFIMVGKNKKCIKCENSWKETRTHEHGTTIQKEL
jgi:hypothetical protein